MKLYTSPASPFGQRITIAARAKGIDIEFVRPPSAGVKSPEFLAINPIGKIPVLLTEKGGVIPESAVILDYLEDRFPTPSLRPRDPEQRARVTTAIHLMDTYVMAPVIRLFPHLNPAQRDDRTVEQEIVRWQHGLSILEHFMSTPLPDAAAGISLADCVLPPSLHLSARIARMLGVQGDLMAPHDVLVAYYSRMKDHLIVGPILDQMTAAQAASDAAKAAGH
jgi:glutathione S-transferase